MKYLSTFEVAKKWGISHRRVAILCNENRIPGAQRAGSRWIIPEDAENPPTPGSKAGNTENSSQRKEGHPKWRKPFCPVTSANGLPI